MVVASSPSAIEFADDKASRNLAIRVRKIYKNVLRVLECTKARRARKVALICSKLANSKALPLLPQSTLFTDLVSYHVSSGKFRKNSYRVFLRMAPATLSELERLIKRSKHLFPDNVQVAGKNILTTKVTKKAAPRKPSYAFNALEDLERIKQLVTSDTKETVQAIVERHVAKKSDPKPVKKAKTVDEEPEEDLAKSITDDDAAVFNTLNRERKDVDIDLGECKMMKRGVVMLGTHIPNIVWKKVFAQLGLQIVAKQYITAMFAPVIASPAEQDGDVLDPTVVLNHANQLVALHNRRQKNDCLKLSIVGDPFKLSNASHWWYLALPLCVVNHASFRFGKWSFTKAPRARTAYAAEVVED